MLHTETAERKALEFLRSIMQDENLKIFHLAGGTALALYLGHRKSIDLSIDNYRNVFETPQTMLPVESEMIISITEEKEMPKIRRQL